MRYSIPNGVLYQELPGEAVVLNLTTAEYFHLNQGGHAAWELIRSGADRQTIEDVLNRDFEAATEIIRSDLDSFLKRMVELKLIIPNETCEAPQC
jgi:hypothetical protein